MFEPTNFPLVSFLFLSESSFIVPRAEVVEGEDNEGDEDVVVNALDVYVYSTEAAPASPTLTATFFLPKVTNRVIDSTILIHADPPPGSPPDLNLMNIIDLEHAPYATPYPFHVGPSNRAIVLTWVLYVVDSETDDEALITPIAHRMLISANTFQSFCAPCPQIVTAVERPWDEWGLDNARFLSTDILENSLVCFVHGSRFVAAVSTPEDQTEGVDGLVLYDINPLASHNWPTLPWTRTDGGTTIPFVARTRASRDDVKFEDQSVFEDQVVNNLPICSTRREERFKDALGLMCDAEHVLFIVVYFSRSIEYLLGAN